MENTLGWIGIALILIAWSVHNLRWSFHLRRLFGEVESMQKQTRERLDSAEKLTKIAKTNYMDSLEEIRKMKAWAEAIKTAARQAGIEVEKEHKL